MQSFGTTRPSFISGASLVGSRLTHHTSFQHKNISLAHQILNTRRGVVTTEALVQDLKPESIALEHLYLDPNNPRFVGPDWVYIPDAEIASDAIQEAARVRLLRDFGVDKLRMNMEVNGYLPIDRVIVREFAQGKFVVLEGNRRICAAKQIGNLALDGSAISPEVHTSLKVIPCLQYVGQDPNAAWLFQGLRHITGISDWSAYSKARLLVEQMEEDELSLTDAGKRFGLTPHGAGQWVRGYYAFKQAREQSDYIMEVDERSYPYFQEIFSRSSASVREWLEWDENERHFDNQLNFNEFVGWLYPKPETDEDEQSEARGDWERRALLRRDDIRQVAFLLSEDKESFEHFRTTKDIEREPIP
jgi:hypothetical protein